MHLATQIVVLVVVAYCCVLRLAMIVSALTAQHCVDIGKLIIAFVFMRIHCRF
jgi:hypothetical protein